MVWTKASLNIAAISLAVSLDIAATTSFAIPAQGLNTLSSQGNSLRDSFAFRASTQQIPDNWQSVEPSSQNGRNSANQRPTASWNAFEPPEGGVPGRREGGGTRGPECPPSVTALIPKSTMGLTGSTQPTFFYYVPSAIDKTAVFELADETDRTLYKTNFRLIANAPGIVSINLPDITDAPSLEIGKNYHWYLTIKCTEADNDNAGDINVSGWINRIELSSTLQTQLEKASKRDRLSIYAQESLWYEYLAALAELRRLTPNDPTVTQKWTELLTSVGLDQIADRPFVETQLIPAN